MSNLKEKVALITGGNSGIGYATAKLFKSKGAEVIITGRSAERVRRAANELQVTGLIADVINLEALGVLAQKLNEQGKKIDVLFVNAGIFSPAPVGGISEEMFDEQMGINFKGAVFTIEKILPLINQGGSIVNLSSINAYTGMPNTAIYGASKAALNAYMRAAAIELAPKNIRINSVNPGPVETPIFGKVGMSEEQLNGFAGAMQQRVPLKRFGQAQEIAKLVGFLASDDASYITGSEYNIDGGMNINQGLNMEG